MSHTTKCGPYTFIHDGDAFTHGSLVEIVNSSGQRFRIHGQYLYQFLAEQIRRERIAELEQASTRELLGIKP